MPFGSVFGAMVFGILGSVLGTRMLGAASAPPKLKGLCMIVLGLSVAAGLLTKRSWARWVGVFAGITFAAFAVETFVEQSGVFPLTIALAAAAVTVLLLIPATGRPIREASSEAAAPSVASRVLLGSASVAILGFLGATAWAVAILPPPQEAATSEPREAEVRTADARPAEARPAEAPKAAAGGPVKWHDFADGMKKAKQGRKLVVADFYATWCGPCKLMEKRTFRDPRVMTRLRDVVPVRVDAEETVDRGGLKGADLALRYSIEMYPTIVVLDGDGREVARNNGVLMPDEFLAWIDAVIERAGTAVARS